MRTRPPMRNAASLPGILNEPGNSPWRFSTAISGTRCTVCSTSAEARLDRLRDRRVDRLLLDLLDLVGGRQRERARLLEPLLELGEALAPAAPRSACAAPRRGAPAPRRSRGGAGDGGGAVRGSSVAASRRRCSAVEPPVRAALPGGAGAARASRTARIRNPLAGERRIPPEGLSDRRTFSGIVSPETAERPQPSITFARSAERRQGRAHAGHKDKGERVSRSTPRRICSTLRNSAPRTRRSPGLGRGERAVSSASAAFRLEVPAERQRPRCRGCRRRRR